MDLFILTVSLQMVLEVGNPVILDPLQFEGAERAPKPLEHIVQVLGDADRVVLHHAVPHVGQGDQPELALHVRDLQLFVQSLPSCYEAYFGVLALEEGCRQPLEPLGPVFG